MDNVTSDFSRENQAPLYSDTRGGVLAYNLVYAAQCKLFFKSLGQTGLYSPTHYGRYGIDCRSWFPLIAS
jgi:hypothetical protein